MRFFGYVIAASLLTLAACGDSEDGASTVQPLPMKTAKQELSYLMGADMAHSQFDQDPRADSLNQDKLVEGFEKGLNNTGDLSGAEQQAIKGLLGPDGRQFNAQFIDDASFAIGKAIGTSFNTSWKEINFMSEFDKKYLVYGFHLGLLDQDTLIAQQPRQKVLNDFMTKVNTRVSSEVERVERAFFDQVVKKKGIKELPQGLYLETLKEGTGASPAITDDVLAHYAVITTKGDTIQSSLAAQPVPFNLSQVIAGWSIGIPYMKKGGKYRLYVPQAMGYGKDGSPDGGIKPFTTLVFYIELKEIGKAGTLAKAR